MSFFNAGLTRSPIQCVEGGTVSTEMDEVSIEEPLQIELTHVRGGKKHRYSVAVMMRTPGNDAELAAGFLFTEGIIKRHDDWSRIEYIDNNHVLVEFSRYAYLDVSKLERQSFVSSSCGVCGKRSIAAVFSEQQYPLTPGSPRLQVDLIHRLPEIQRKAQDNFHRTGGIHASALFDANGNLLSLFEDVGRHNALDKLIGNQMFADKLPLTQHILLLSGRASFELIQKACMAGIRVVAAVGAPSSLAVQLARETSMTLLGFVRENRFNVYADAGRLQFHRTSAPEVDSQPTEESKLQ